MSNIPKLKRVIRLDSVPLNQTYFTDEGYLIDHPIVTTVGIFEYHNPDGSVRKELRLPEEVFSKKSLESYKGKPVIITHDAGVVNKDNVADEEIGCILSEGYKDKNDENNVRAEIIIHDTDAMKKSGLKELSLGYNLTLDETAGEWNGEHYDAIQRDIEINHLALVREARAGESARLNIDGKDKGAEKMAKRRFDGDPESLEEAVEKFKVQNKPEEEKQGMPTNAGTMSADEDEEMDRNMREHMMRKPLENEGLDEDDENMLENAQNPNERPVPPEGQLPTERPLPPENEDEDEEISDEERIRMVRDRRDRRDEAGDPADTQSAMGVIAQQDEDIDSLLKILDKKKAKEDFAKSENVDGCNGTGAATADALGNKKINADAVDKIVSQKLELCRLGDKLRMDGIEKMSIYDAKKAIIKKVKPTINLDGKSNVYIDAMFDITKDTIREKKSTDIQRGQMVNNDSKDFGNMSSAAEARRKMIERNEK